MKLSPQHKKILEVHADKEWHCSTEIEFIRDQRKRISELNAMGYELYGAKCTLHKGKHSSNLFMRKLLNTPPLNLYQTFHLQKQSQTEANRY